MGDVVVRRLLHLLQTRIHKLVKI